jgi:hypothetical protein
MRLVFTKLETPAKSILVDIGNGFEEIPLEELQDSTAGRYLQLSNKVIPSLIRVKVSSADIGAFDVIKEYQITDDEGNILGGNISQITFPLELVKYKVENEYFTIMFPHDITKTGEYVGLTSDEARGPYFETIVVTRLHSMGFRGHTIGSASGDKLFIKSRSEENH